MQEPERRQNLWERVQQLGDLLGVAVQSPVIPLVVGDEATALAASAQLLKKGFHVPAIRPPTVPKNTSRSTLNHACDTMAAKLISISYRLCKLADTSRHNIPVIQSCVVLSLMLLQPVGFLCQYCMTKMLTTQEVAVAVCHPYMISHGPVQ